MRAAIWAARTVELCAGAPASVGAGIHSSGGVSRLARAVSLRSAVYVARSECTVVAQIQQHSRVAGGAGCSASSTCAKRAGSCAAGGAGVIFGDSLCERGRAGVGLPHGKQKCELVT